MLPLLVNSKPGAYMATLTLNALDGVFMPGAKVTIRDVTILAPLVGVALSPGLPAWASLTAWEVMPAWAGCIYCADLSDPDDHSGTDPWFPMVRLYGAKDFTTGLGGGVGSVAFYDRISRGGSNPVRYHLTNSADFGKVVVTFQVG